MTKTCRMIQVAVLLVMGGMPFRADAASCPKCGREYGAVDPRDEARFAAIRAAHEASCSGSSSMSSGQAGGGSFVPSGPSPAEIERQRRSQAASSLNLEGLKYWNQYDWARAAECFRKALEMDPNRPVIRSNLRRAEELLAEQKKQQEETRLMDEANRKVNRMLRDISVSLDNPKGKDASSLTPGSPPAVPPAGGALDFMESREPLYSKGSPTSAPVNLRRADQHDLPIVDPRVVKGQMTPEEARTARERDAKVQAAKESASAAAAKHDYQGAISQLKAALQLRPDDRDIQMALGAVLHAKDMQEGKTVKNPKVDAILDAFEFGRGDWGKSISYLQGACRANPNHLGYRDAFAFVQGMSGFFLEPSVGGNAANTDTPLPPQTKELLAKAAVSAATGDYYTAITCYQQAHQLAPANLTIRDLLHFTEGRSARQTTSNLEKGGKRPGPFDPSPEDSKGLLPAVAGQESGKSK